MSDISRRAFLKQGGVGVAAAGAMVAMPKVLRHGEDVLRSHSHTPGAAAGAAGADAADAGVESTGHTILVHVPDARSGEVRVMYGTREVVHHDADLVARLVRATRP
jgi:hypothetical protein